jgi:hypothetical protein
MLPSSDCFIDGMNFKNTHTLLFIFFFHLSVIIIDSGSAEDDNNKSPLPAITVLPTHYQ